MGNTPLCVAASTDAIESLKVLLKYKASLENINNEGGTPISEAVKYGSLQCA